MMDKILGAFPANDEESVKTMDLVTFCTILGFLVQAQDELAEGCTGAANNKLIYAEEIFYAWYEYGEEVSLED